MRQAMIYYQDDLAGILVETNDGDYEFTYDKEYVRNFPDRFLTMKKCRPMNTSQCALLRLMESW